MEQGINDAPVVQAKSGRDPQRRDLLAARTPQTSQIPGIVGRDSVLDDVMEFQRQLERTLPPGRTADDQGRGDGEPCALEETAQIILNGV